MSSPARVSDTREHLASVSQGNKGTSLPTQNLAQENCKRKKKGPRKYLIMISESKKEHSVKYLVIISQM